MTSQNSEIRKTTSSPKAKNNNCAVGRSVLMKERNPNTINNKNILLFNRQVNASNGNVKTSNIVEINPTPSSNITRTACIANLLQSRNENFFHSDIQIVKGCGDGFSEKKSGSSTKEEAKIHKSSLKKETPLLQIFDGNVIISQELSIEEVQNLLIQINSKLQNQNNVNSVDFPNVKFSREENSDVEIIIDDDDDDLKIKEKDKFAPTEITTLLETTKPRKWIDQTFGTNNRRLLLKSASVSDKIEESLNRPSTSSDANLIISFEPCGDCNTETADFEHDYSSSNVNSNDNNNNKNNKNNNSDCINTNHCNNNRKSNGQYSNKNTSKESEKSKKDDAMVEQVIVENAETELMQIELIESDSGSASVSTVSSTNYASDKDGEPIKLPDNLESVPKAEYFPTQRHRWNTNEEIAAILISFDKHNYWQSKEVKIRPKSGSMLLYSRKKVRYRRDGYCWKKRKDGKTTREDHMKLKVQGTECIYGCYVHSAILPTFHRRCYWLLQNPDIVLVHYLNVPYPDDNKLAVLAPSLTLWGDKKEWTKEELVSQLKPMFYSEEERDLNNELEISVSKLGRLFQTAETVETIVTQLMEKQRAARAATLTKQLECGCPDSTCADGKTCSHPMRRITAANVKQEPNTRVIQMDSNNQVSSTTGSGMLLTSSGANGSNSTTIHHRATRNDRLQHGTQSHSSPLVLSLSQIHGGGSLSLSQIQGGANLLILNNPSASANSNHASSSVAMVTNFKCTTAPAAQIPQPPPLKQYHHPRNKATVKQEAMEQLSCFRMTNTSADSQQHKHSLDNTSRNGSNINVSSASHFENAVFSRDKNLGKILNSAPVTPTKCLDSSDNNSGDTILIFNSSDTNQDTSASPAVSGSNFYTETLDLSQEDIQRTLSANMPLADLNSHRNSHSKSPSPSSAVIPPDVMVSEINPMELMDSPPTVVDDDVFVNLDAFDMLSDFPELEVLDHSGSNSETALAHGSNQETNNSISNNKNNNKRVKDESSSNFSSDPRELSASITDYSPEWAYPEGGVKVLVTGPWYSSTSTYTILFDSFPVPTSLVQSGVLRCFCPAHEVGLATVQVACEGFVISNSVMFEYKRPPNDDVIKLKEPKLEENENLLKFTLLQRLEAIDERLQIKQEPGGGDMSDSNGFYHQGANFEERMVNYCQDMTNRQWRSDEPSPDWSSSLRGMTLLHLAASLGFTRLVCALLHWRAENSSLLLETEIDALSQDNEGFTPLMWACGRGHRETALVLYRWNHMALHIHNSSNQTALGYARAKGQDALADEIEKLESSREEANMTLLSNTFNNLERSSHSDSNSNVSPSYSMVSLHSAKSHDGIFLRPDPVSKYDNRFKTISLGVNFHSSDRSTTPSPTLGLTDDHPHKLVKRPSLDSGINLGSCQSDSFSSLRSSRFKTHGSGETPKLSRFDRSMSLPSPAISDSFESDGRRMDFALCEVSASGPSSNNPTYDVENLSEDDVEVNTSQVGEQEVRVLTLAEQIIAAIPERIKNESEEMQLDTSPHGESSLASDALSDSLMEPLLDEPSSSYRASEFNFEFSDHNYRYYDVGTPSSSLSPASSSLQSPSPGFPLDSPSPPPTTQDFCEFFHASGSIFEKDFSNLTLSDREQRELYEAAKIIQKAYRSYKGRKKSEEDKERAAAILIQNYYRRYKQYAYFKQVTHAAMVIQNGYRSYCEHKRFKKSQEAAVCIQNYYRHYKEQGELRKASRETTPSAGLKRTYSQRRQHQAACKIQQFMRQSKNKLQRERALAAEKERQDARQFFQDVLPKSPSPGNFDANKCSEKNPDEENR